MDLSGIFRGLVGLDGFRAGDKSLWKRMISFSLAADFVPAALLCVCCSQFVIRM